MNYHYSFSLRLIFRNAAEPRIIYAAIKPELFSAHSKRSLSRIMVKKSMLSLSIDSADLVALRASANSLLKKIILAKSILEAE